MEGPGDVAEIELRLDLSACAKSKEFLRKTKDFRCQWGGWTRGCRRNSMSINANQRKTSKKIYENQ